MHNTSGGVAKRMSTQDTGPSFEVHQDEPTSGPLLTGLFEYGLAGFTAADYLVEQLSLEPVGHVQSRGVPSVTPFTDGEPRHHTRLLGGPDAPVTVLLNEQFLPMPAAGAFSEALLGWTDEADLQEVCVLSGVPIPHGPDDHRTFYVATSDFQAQRLADVDVPAMGHGYLDGVPGRLMSRGIDAPLATGALITPAHDLSPDLDAALRLLGTVVDAYDLPVDTEPLEEFTATVNKRYETMAERMAQIDESELPEDRAYY